MASRPDLKVDDEAGFIKLFRSLDTDTDTIRVFDRSDYYTAHGDDAVFIARTIYKTTSVLRQIGRSDNPLPSVTMTITVFRNFLREALFRLGKRVEIWQNSGRMAWKVAKQASPGNLQDVEDELGGYIDAAPIIMAVKISAKAAEARNVGICFADASVRELGVSEFLDNELYSNLEATMIQLGVKECLITADTSAKKDPELTKIKQMCDNCNTPVSEKPMQDFNTRDVEQDLERLLRDERSAAMLPQTDLKLAMGAAAALIKYLNIMTDASNHGQYSLYQHDLSQYMKLDASALKALNLMPGPRDGAKTMSLYGLLNHCKTPTGSRLLAQWLKQPLMSVEEIEKRQQLVEAFVTDTELRQTMQEEHLKLIPDLYRLAKKFQRKVASLEDVVRAYQVSIRLPAFLGTLEGVMDEAYKDTLDSAYTKPLKECSNSMGRLQEMVETTIDLDALDNHEFIIKPEYDDSLRIIRKKLDRLKNEITAEYRRVGNDLNVDTDKKLFLEQHRVHGWCLRLTRAEASIIRNKKAYAEISTQKNGVYFTTTDLSHMRREFDDLSEKYNRTQSGLAGEVITVAASYVPVLERLASVLSHLDVIVSFAHASIHAPTPYTRPKIHPRASECLDKNIDAATVLNEARHPCLEAQDDVAFITNDVHLAPGANGPSFLIITGPNMGGKSTYIRMMACIALLAQIGCFVPAAEGASLTLYDAILARVGASDSTLKGVSTFMSEMLETSHILKSASRDSLIVIDELGRGTSTYDGFGLAWAIAEHIITRIGAPAAFATHFHEVTALAEKHPQVRNLHVVAHVSGVDAGADDSMDVDTDTARPRREVTLLYKVEPGVSDQSFGIHVAELVRFPRKVINMARQKAAELDAAEADAGAGFPGAAVDALHAAGEDPVEAEARRRAAADGVAQAEIEEGSRRIKAVLKEWAGRTDSRMDKDAQMRVLADLVQADEALLANRFFQQVRAL